MISLTRFFTRGFSANNGSQPRIDQTYQVLDNFTRIMGHHTFKAGFAIDRFQVFNPFFNNLGGNFTLNGSGTLSRGTRVPTSCLGFLTATHEGAARSSMPEAENTTPTVRTSGKSSRT